jgi:hypothetical protein
MEGGVWCGETKSLSRRESIDSQPQTGLQGISHCLESPSHEPSRGRVGGMSCKVLERPVYGAGGGSRGFSQGEKGG